MQVRRVSTGEYITTDYDEKSRKYNLKLDIYFLFVFIIFPKICSRNNTIIPCLIMFNMNEKLESTEWLHSCCPFEAYSAAQN
jgi:hypothetical protein